MGKKIRENIAYIVTNLTPEQASPEDILFYVRNYWHIENRSHYVRDETFREDRSTIRTGNGPRIMATLRNLGIGLLRLMGATNIAEATRHFCFNQNLATALL